MPSSNNNSSMPVFISDKLTESETQRLVAVLEKVPVHHWVFSPGLERGSAPTCASIAFLWNQTISHPESTSDAWTMR